MCSMVWAVAWRARAAAVIPRSLDVTVFSRACTLRLRSLVPEFCREMEGSGRAWQEGPWGGSSPGCQARGAGMAGVGVRHREAEG